MPDRVLARIPVVGGLAYAAPGRGLPRSFTATLVPEKDNRYLPHAVAVVVDGRKVGYVAPEISRRYFEPLTVREGQPATCPGRPASPTDRETSGVEVLLDFTSLPVTPLP